MVHPREEPRDDSLWGLWEKKRSQHKRGFHRAPKSPDMSCSGKSSYLALFLCNCFPSWPSCLGLWEQHSTSSAQFPKLPSWKLTPGPSDISDLQGRCFLAFPQSLDRAMGLKDVTCLSVPFEWQALRVSTHQEVISALDTLARKWPLSYILTNCQCVVWDLTPLRQRFWESLASHKLQI